MRFLDLRQRALRSFNYFTGCIDRRNGYVPYFGCNVAGAAAFLQHAPWDEGDVTSRFLEALLLVRRLTGNRSGEGVELRLKERVEHSILTRGLLYRGEHRWCKAEAWMFDQSRCLLALVAWAAEEPERVQPLMARMIDHLAVIAVKQGEAFLLPAENWTGRAWGTEIIGHPPTGMPIEGLVDWYRLTGDASALALAGHFVRGMFSLEQPVFSEDGALLVGGHHTCYTHIHSRLAILIGMWKYALATDDADLDAFVRRAFAHVLALSSSFGWVPESLENGCTGPAESNINEMCCTADCLTLFLLLAEQGETERYDMVERFVYNQVNVQQQLALAPVAEFAHFNDSLGENEEYSYVRVGQRLLGGFQGAVHPNDFVRMIDPVTPWIESSGCCSPAGVKSLCLVHAHVLDDLPGKRARLNLYFPAENDSLALAVAAQPNTLQLDIREPLEELLIRQPAWSEALLLTDTQGTPIAPRRDAHYLALTHLRAGTTLLLHLRPLSRTTEEHFANGHFQVSWEGPRVLDMSPKGEKLPIYQPGSLFGE